LAPAEPQNNEINCEFSQCQGLKSAESWSRVPKTRILREDHRRPLTSEWFSRNVAVVGHLSVWSFSGF